MRSIRLLLTVGALASMVVALPAQAAGTITSLCTLSDVTTDGDRRSGSLSSGIATSNDDTSPEVICTVQTTPQPGFGTVAIAKARGLACVDSECKGDYWVCYDSICHGDGFVCVDSTCHSGSVCVDATCVPPPADPPAGGARATWLTPTDVQFVASPQAPLFTCTNVRWYRGDTVAHDQFFGCTQVAQ